MKKFLCFCLISLTLIFCACGKKDAMTKMIDFTDYTVYDVIEWANENDVTSKFTYVYSSDTDKPAGSVIAQSLENGKPLTDGIVITVASNSLLLAGSEAKETVPDIIGKSAAEAKEELTALGFQYDVIYTSSGKEKDTVVLSDPLPGIAVPKNSKVVLTVSSGRRESQVSLVLSIKAGAAEDNVIKVYIDGELDRSKTVCLDSSETSKAFCFQGTGKKEIKFEINNVVTAVYNIDFSSGKVYLIE